MNETKIFQPKKTAILIDLSFFIKVYGESQGKHFTPNELAKRIRDYSYKTLHVYEDHLFRVLVYDCPPLEGRVKYPISKQDLLFQNTETYKFRQELLTELKKQPYFAVRLGKVSKSANWNLKPEILKQILNGKKQIDGLKDNDFTLGIKQKGVDIKIGLDIASLSIKKNVEKIILITGDSDFVPAIKFARREGVIIQLDPLRKKVSEDLLEHIDLLYSILPETSS